VNISAATRPAALSSGTASVGPKKGVTGKIRLGQPQLVRRRYVHTRCGPQALGVGGHVAQGLQEGACGALVIGVGELGADAAVVGHVNVDLVVLAQPVRGAVDGGPSCGRW
jgi:hypothetical protein